MKTYIILISSPNIGPKWSVGITPEGLIEVEGNPDMGVVAKQFWECMAKEGSEVYSGIFEAGRVSRQYEIDKLIEALKNLITCFEWPRSGQINTGTILEAKALLESLQVQDSQEGEEK